MTTKNLNYFYYVEYCDDPQMILHTDSDATQNKLQRKNGELANYLASACKLMKPLNENIVPNHFELRTAYPGLLVGTGLPHGFGGKGEAALGLTLDYVTGMPYIPSSSVKGALRSAFVHKDYIKELLKSADIDVANFETSIFGSSHSDKSEAKVQGSDIFFDAIITSTGKILDTDNITSHRHNKDLLELAAPNPITMIRIRPDVTFKFQFQLTDYEKGKIKITAKQKLGLFKQILIDLGIGAKTNVGYGSFVDSFVCPRCGGKKGANHPTCQKCSIR